MSGPEGRVVGSSYARHIATHFVEETLEIPILPAVAQEVLKLASDPSADAAQLSKLVHKDPALAAHVLKIANSAAFGGSRGVVSLQQAVTRLGLRLLKEIAVTIGMREVFSLRGREAQLSGLWRASVGGALWSKEVARLGRRNVESAFLAGLLQNIGTPVALVRSVKEAKRIKPAPSEVEIDAAVLRWSRHVGIRVAEVWKLPEVTRAAVEFHDKPGEAGVHSMDVWTAVFGAFLATQDDEVVINGHPAVFELNLYPMDIEALLGCRDAINGKLEALCL